VRPGAASSANIAPSAAGSRGQRELAKELPAERLLKVGPLLEG
jgi:hypothetical protein